MARSAAIRGGEEIRAKPPRESGLQMAYYKKTQPLRCTHQIAILAPSEEQFKHHVVSEQDVRWIAPYGISFEPPLLPRIAFEANERLPFR